MESGSTSPRTNASHGAEERPGPTSAEGVCEIVNDPHWFPAELDRKRGAILFVRADRSNIARQAFLDDRWDHSGYPSREMPLEGLCPDPLERPNLSFIWHTSFCSSTAMTRM